MQDTNKIASTQHATTVDVSAGHVQLSEESKQKRTTGLKVFDAFLYPFLTNFVVFGISVVATYLTSHGDKVGGSVGKWLHSRGEKFMDVAQNKFKMTHDQADMAKMVTFSFLDGSLMAPVVKLLEDRREKIAKRIDTMLGTKPEDESVYEAEPKQTWGSVLMGRFAVSAVIVPLAVAMDKIQVPDKNSEGGKTNLNNKLLRNPGEAMAKRFKEKNPEKYNKLNEKYDVNGLFRVGMFEAFYTSVCTAGLYVSSRMIAAFQGKKKDAKNQPKSDTQAVPTSAPTNKDDAKDVSVKENAQEQTVEREEPVTEATHARDEEQETSSTPKFSEREENTSRKRPEAAPESKREAIRKQEAEAANMEHAPAL